MAASKVTLKLLIDTMGRKVLFAEAGKDFVDFLFNLLSLPVGTVVLSLPVGTVVRLLTKNAMVGCLGNLYDSIENLSETYMQPNQSKDCVLNPKAPIYAAEVPLLLADDVSLTRKFYMCSSYHRNVAEDPKAVCPQCKHAMSTEVPSVARAVAKEGSSGSGDQGGWFREGSSYLYGDG